MQISTEDLSQDKFVLMLFIATAGYHDFLMSLIKRALFFQLSTSSIVLNTEHFSKAWETDITSSVRLSTTNPFGMSEKELFSFYKSIH